MTRNIYLHLGQNHSGDFLGGKGLGGRANVDLHMRLVCLGHNLHKGEKVSAKSYATS